MPEREPYHETELGVLHTREVEYAATMSYELIESWGDGIPAFSEADASSPEWNPTPVVQLDLSGDGYGTVYVKNEADRASNPTGTIKDRAAWELATLYRDYARALYLKLRAGTMSKAELTELTIPRLSLITAGNEGRAIAERFAHHNLPPPKLILSADLEPSIRIELEKLRADIYVTDLNRELTTGDILKLSNNEGGQDITSIRSIEPQSIFYDWHVHEVFNELPDEVYVPYGSGRLMENYLTWQERSMKNDSAHTRDPRLRVPLERVLSASILGAEADPNSKVADKLAARFKPFTIFKDNDIRALVNLAYTGRESNRYRVSDVQIAEAHSVLRGYGIDAEPSAAAGLALYFERFNQGLVNQKKKVLVVNTGQGLEQQKH